MFLVFAESHARGHGRARVQTTRIRHPQRARPPPDRPHNQESSSADDAAGPCVCRMGPLHALLTHYPTRPASLSAMRTGPSSHDSSGDGGMRVMVKVGEMHCGREERMDRGVEFGH